MPCSDELDLVDAVIDGEVIPADETGRPQFYDLLRRTRSAAYAAFDILWCAGCRLAVFAAKRAPACPAIDLAGEIIDR
jgi:ATP-dependent DNA ligase